MKLAEIFSLNSSYSTTRRLSKIQPNHDNAILYPAEVLQGGLRTKGFFKHGGTDKKLITVVTVVYNGAIFLNDTIESVINQTYDNVEFIVIDGGSTDGSLEIIKKNEEKIDYWISDADKGIYDAMNKALKLALGEFIIFLNSDDYFATPQVLENIARMIDGDVEFIYGKVKIIDEKREFIRGESTKYKDLVFENIYHQSVFYKTALLKDINGFDCRYRIAADYDSFLKVFKNKGKTVFYEGIVSSVRLGGVSSIFFSRTIDEKLSVTSKHYGKRVFLKAWIYYKFISMPLILIRNIFVSVGLIKLVRRMLGKV